MREETDDPTPGVVTPYEASVEAGTVLFKYQVTETAELLDVQLNTAVPPSGILGDEVKITSTLPTVINQSITVHYTNLI